MRLVDLVRCSCTVTLLAATLLATQLAAPPAGATQRHGDPPTGAVPYHEVFAPDGRIETLPGAPSDRPPKLGKPAAAPAVTAILNSGRVDNRFSFAFVGDGYTQSQLPLYARNVTTLLNGSILSVQPFATYRNYINAYRVDLASTVSGVSNDPTQGIVRNTPLGMRFYCYGIARLLCVDTAAATSYAGYAPGHDNVVAVANTGTYGGSGGSVTAVAGGNATAGQIVSHEMGHSIGGLGDEYDTPYDRANGVEPTFPNVTAHTAAQLVQARTKWYRWLGAATPDGGTIGAFEGANLFRYGYYRPSLNSLMRTLGRPFNLPSAEALVVAFYQKVRPIDYATAVGSTQSRTSTVTVVPMRPTGHNLNITWRLDSVPISAAANRGSVNLSTVPMTAGRHVLTVTVVDPTTYVRDPALRDRYLTQTLTWPVKA